MQRLSLSFPEQVNITAKVETGDFVLLFSVDGEEITIFRDHTGALVVGGAPTGYRPLDPVPTTTEALRELILERIARLLEFRGPSLH